MFLRTQYLAQYARVDACLLVLIGDEAECVSGIASDIEKQLYLIFLIEIMIVLLSFTLVTQ